MANTSTAEPGIWRDQHGLSGERHRAFSALLRGHAAVLRRVEDLSRRQGALPPEWYDILLALEYTPEGRLRIGDLSCHASLSRSGLTRLVDRLEAAGLVVRQINPTDRRSFEVILTERGREERKKTWPIYAGIISQVFGELYTDEEATLLADLLSRQFQGQPDGGCGAGCDAGCDGELLADTGCVGGCDGPDVPG